MAIRKSKSSSDQKEQHIRVVELFAGVGGFHVGLEGVNFRGTRRKNNGFKVVWANQWEPPGTPKKQYAFDCYKKRFGKRIPAEDMVNEDLAVVLDEVEAGKRALPECEMLVGGFPCQDYSVARPLPQARGIQGKKGILWWEIYRMLTLYGDNKPKYLLLENVDRMLKSPKEQRGRDFAIMLSCLASLGYSVEWRDVNAADYGNPQRRRRVFVYAELTDDKWDLRKRIVRDGVEAMALPVNTDNLTFSKFEILSDPYEVSITFGQDKATSPFLNAGAMQNCAVVTAKVQPKYSGKYQALGDALIDEDDVPEEFFISENAIEKWKYHKGGKRIPRVNKTTGHEYIYAEGSMVFPDPVDRPARTILTSEGGGSASRAKHAVATKPGKLRRLVPDELDVLSGFPKGWTDTGMTDGQRAFCIGNALVVDIVRRIGKEISRRHQAGE